MYEESDDYSEQAESTPHMPNKNKEVELSDQYSSHQDSSDERIGKLKDIKNLLEADSDSSGNYTDDSF